MHTNMVFQLHEVLILAFIQCFTHLKVICGFDSSFLKNSQLCTDFWKKIKANCELNELFIDKNFKSVFTKILSHFFPQNYI